MFYIIFNYYIEFIGVFSNERKAYNYKSETRIVAVHVGRGLHICNSGGGQIITEQRVRYYTIRLTQSFGFLPSPAGRRDFVVNAAIHPLSPSTPAAWGRLHIYEAITSAYKAREICNVEASQWKIGSREATFKCCTLFFSNKNLKKSYIHYTTNN